MPENCTQDCILTSSGVCVQYHPLAFRAHCSRSMALAYVTRRLRGKHCAPAHYVANPAVLQALAEKGWRELTSLADDARRRHMYWVHVTANYANHGQPDAFSTAEFWEHMYMSTLSLRTSRGVS